MRESKVEKLLREGVEAAGGMCEKFVSPGKAGVPDRIVTWHGEVHFVELKKPGEEPEDRQVRDHRRRRARRVMVFVLDSEEAVGWYLASGRNLLWHEYCRLTDSEYPSRAWILGNRQ
jgi:hypothetical protein